MKEALVNGRPALISFDRVAFLPPHWRLIETEERGIVGVIDGSGRQVELEWRALTPADQCAVVRTPAQLPP